MIMCMEKTCCNLIAAKHRRSGLSCMQKLHVECMSSAWSVWHVGVSVMLSTIVAAEHGTYGLSCTQKASCGVSSAEYLGV